MGKIRKYQTYVSISASGPEFNPKFEARGFFMRPRMAADLKYTTADVDFLEQHWRQPAPDSGVEEYIRVRNPTVRNVQDAFAAARDWLATRKKVETDWDGGSINVTYAGHGRSGDGAFVLKDGAFGLADLIDALNSVASAVSAPDHNLRVSMLLDSCYSGALLIPFLIRVLGDENLHLFVRDAMAASMTDEVAWEESSIGHGVFTYAFSVRGDNLAALAAKAVQPDNSIGSSISIVGGPLGCSLLTAGEQNPLDYAGGAELRVCETAVPLLDSTDKPRPIGDIEADIRKERDRFKGAMQFVSRSFRMKGQREDAEVRRDLEKLLSESEGMDRTSRDNPLQGK